MPLIWPGLLTQIHDPRKQLRPAGADAVGPRGDMYELGWRPSRGLDLSETSITIRAGQATL